MNPKQEKQQEERHSLSCSSYHTKLAGKNPRWNYIINAQSQNRKALRRKTYEIYVPIRSDPKRIIKVDWLEAKQSNRKRRVW